ncbi:MAG: hypothetical protein ACFE9S_10565 [Candidatus Hermodarchaeota archaeon]
MNALLKSFNLSDDAINVYLKGLGKFPYTFSEIKSIIPDVSDKEVKQIIDDLIEKKLVLLVNPLYSDSVPHYLIIPPYSAILNNLNSLTEVPDNKEIDKAGTDQLFEKFRENLLQDLEKISGDLIDLLSNKDDSGQTIEILSEVEENVKKFSHVILNDVSEMITPLRLQSGVDARDFTKLINSVKQKISESEEIVANMFSQFKDIVKNLDSPNMKTEVEAFKTFIRKLGESIDNRVHELSLSTSSPSSDNIQALEKSLYTILSDFISENQDPLEKFWSINSKEKIKEIISGLLEKSETEITIIVPTIKDFIPLEKFKLDYSEDQSLTQKITEKSFTQKKPVRTRPTITKKQKQEIIDKIDATSKKVSELKGFELSHDVADILAFISEINPESTVIDSIQGWLNRLLVIRKHLDSNTQYLLLEDIERWKKDHSKIKKIEEKPEREVVDEIKSKLTEEKATKETDSLDLQIKIISSDSHENKHALALAKKSNIEYLKTKKNNIIAVNGDNSSLIFGVYEKNTKNFTIDISGFLTTYKPMIEIFTPVLDEIVKNAQYPKEVEINRGFNEIIENINDFKGNKISKKLKSLLDVVFEKEGISLDILELKLLVGKLEKIYQPLDNEMKEYVIYQLNNLNTKFSSLELVYPPGFRPPINEEENKGEIELEITPPQVKPLDPEKLDNLFEILLEKIGELKGVEIGEQIDKFIDVILELQGYSNIIEWRDSLRDVSESLEEPFKEKIKEDLLSWKLGLLQQTPISKLPKKEESTEALRQTVQENPSSIFEEEYISPGLSQSQFGTEEESISNEEENKVDPKTEMKILLNKIDVKLNDLTGIEISKLMQNIVDIILETDGYSMALKSVKDWITKLRKIKGTLEEEDKNDFLLEFQKWKDKYSGEDNETTIDISPSYEMVEESHEIGENGGDLNDKFSNLIENAQSLNGDQLSSDLQSIADILLQSHGAVAVNVIRQWISKLRSIKEPLEDDIKEEFLAEIEKWKEKFV